MEVEILKTIGENRGSPAYLHITVKLDSLQELDQLLGGHGIAKPDPAQSVKDQLPPPSSGDDLEQPVTQKEAMKFLGQTRQSFFNLRRRGIIKGYKLGGRIYFYKSELRAALEEC